MAKTHLTFQISEQGCALAEINGDSVNYLGDFLFEEKKDFQYKERLLKFITDKGIQELKSDEVSVSWLSPNACLVPYNIFQSGSAESIFKTCFNKSVAAGDIDYNRISEASLVTVYEIPLWVKSFFVVRFPRVSILHEQSHLLKGIFNGNTYNLTIHVMVYPEFLTLIFTEKNELLYCNSFEINHLNDVLYYLSFAFQQQSPEKKEGNIHFSISKQNQFVKEEQLQEELGKINLFRQFKLTFDSLSSFKFQKFCV